MIKEITIDMTALDDPFVRAVRRVQRWADFAFRRMLALDWRWVDDSISKWGSTDGLVLNINEQAINRLTETSDPGGRLAFLLLHEILHAQLNHGVRLAPLADHSTANEAADYIVNDIIHEINMEAMRLGAVEPPFPFIDGILWDPDLSGDKSVEALYYELVRSKQQQQQQQEQQPQTQPGTGDPLLDAAPQSGGDTPPPSGPVSESLTKQTGDSTGDAAIMPNFPGTGKGDDTFEPTPEGGQTLEDVTREIDRINEQVVVDESWNRAAGIGNSGKFNDTLLEQGKPDSMGNWLQRVQEWFRDRSPNGWKNPISIPVYLSSGTVTPGRGGDSIGTFVLAFDVSGSVNKQYISNFLAEGQRALDDLPLTSVVVLACNRDVKVIGEFFPGDTLPDTIPTGGGTRFEPAFRWAEENVPDCAGLVYMTDGRGKKDFRAPEFPVLWIDWTCRPHQFPWGEAVGINQA